MPSVAPASQSSRPDHINQLILGVDRYNPNNVHLLEDYVEAQIKDGEYDQMANLALLKLYQFNPGLASPHMIVQTLLLALAAPRYPSAPDLSLALALALDRPPASLLPGVPVPGEDDDDEDGQVDSRDYVGEVTPALREMSALLRECKYRQFWQCWKSGGGEGGELLRSRYIPQHPHILSLLRTQITSSISSSFSRIPLALLGKWLDLDAAAAREFVQNGTVQGWSVDGENVAIAGNGDNDVKPGVIKETVELKQLTKLISAAAY